MWRFLCFNEVFSDRMLKLASHFDALTSGPNHFLADAWHGAHSALDPAGDAATEIATLFWVMAVGAAIIWLAMVGLGIYSFRTHQGLHSPRLPWFIIGGGMAVPSVVLAVLLGFGLSAMPRLVGPAPSGALRVYVTGEQWWWRVAYGHPANSDSQRVELANEIHLPVDRPVEFVLNSSDVIHSFWIPSLAGKVDTFPGRTTRLVLTPTCEGIYQGICAEFCGGSHAWMEFTVVVESAEAFEEWLAAQATSAFAVENETAAQGQLLFRRHGCGACHTVRGQVSRSRVGPDLTHVGSRHSLAAGRLPNDRESLMRWLRDPKELKPEALMPSFAMLSDKDLTFLAAYLNGLK